MGALREKIQERQGMWTKTGQDDTSPSGIESYRAGKDLQKHTGWPDIGRNIVCGYMVYVDDVGEVRQEVPLIKERDSKKWEFFQDIISIYNYIYPFTYFPIHITIHIWDFCRPYLCITNLRAFRRKVFLPPQNESQGRGEKQPKWKVEVRKYWFGVWV